MTEARVVNCCVIVGCIKSWPPDN